MFNQGGVSPSGPAALAFKPSFGSRETDARLGEAGVQNGVGQTPALSNRRSLRRRTPQPARCSLSVTAWSRSASETRRNSGRVGVSAVEHP